MDECAASPSPCDQNATCTNTIGSYICKCKTGFTGDGKTCAGNFIFNYEMYFFYFFLFIVFAVIFSSWWWCCFVFVIVLLFFVIKEVKKSGTYN